jgi:hypothetical protein
MIKVKCDKCRKELKETGGLVFSPPFDIEYVGSVTQKLHVCRKCYDKLLKWMQKK